MSTTDFSWRNYLDEEDYDTESDEQDSASEPDIPELPNNGNVFNVSINTAAKLIPRPNLSQVSIRPKAHASTSEVISDWNVVLHELEKRQAAPSVTDIQTTAQAQAKTLHEDIVFRRPKKPAVLATIVSSNAVGLATPAIIIASRPPEAPQYPVKKRKT